MAAEGVDYEDALDEASHSQWPSAIRPLTVEGHDAAAKRRSWALSHFGCDVSPPTCPFEGIQRGACRRRRLRPALATPSSLLAVAELCGGRPRDLVRVYPRHGAQQPPPPHVNGSFQPVFIEARLPPSSCSTRGGRAGHRPAAVLGDVIDAARAHPLARVPPPGAVSAVCPSSSADRRAALRLLLEHRRSPTGPASRRGRSRLP